MCKWSICWVPFEKNSSENLLSAIFNCSSKLLIELINIHAGIISLFGIFCIFWQIFLLLKKRKYFPLLFSIGIIEYKGKVFQVSALSEYFKHSKQLTKKTWKLIRPINQTPLCELIHKINSKQNNFGSLIESFSEKELPDCTSRKIYNNSIYCLNLYLNISGFSLKTQMG